MPGAESLLLSAPSGWNPSEAGVDVVAAAGLRSPHSEELIDYDRAAHPMADGGLVTVRRNARTTRIAVPDPPGADLIVHPLLAFTAAMCARRDGRQAFRAGALELDGRAWGVIAPQGAGKSSLMAALHQLR